MVRYLFKNRICYMCLMIVVITFAFSIPCLALHPQTHRAINEKVADKNSSINNFSIHQYLIDQLGFKDGVEKDIIGKRIWKFIGDGGEQEDSMGVRSFNHFHNPLTNTGLSQSYSALTWATLPIGGQNLAPLSSWNDVRYYYERALTEKEKKSREDWFARTFQGVGQIMHLVEDMSVPAHTPNHQSYKHITCQEV